MRLIRGRQATPEFIMKFGCRKCDRSFEELELWNRLEFCGDHWKCTSCNEALTKDPEQWMKEVNAMAKLLWDTSPLEDF